MKKLLILSLTLIFTFIGCGDDSDGGGKDSGIDHTKACNDILSCGISTQSVESCHDGNIQALNTNDQFQEGFISSSQLSAALKCMSDAGSCTDTKECIKNNMGIDFTDETCDTNAETCDGNILTDCRSGKKVKYDCTKYGLKCFEYQEGEAGCYEDYMVECDETFVASCDGDKPLNCYGFVYKGDCSIFENGVCKVDEEDNWAYCTGPDDAEDCDEWEYEANCDGNNFKKCENGKVVMIDCTKVGSNYQCIDNEEDTGCFYNVAECENDDVTCEDGVLTYCYDGETQTFDCVANGYTSCQQTGTEGYIAMCIY